jgi:nucleotide-binding universal stress UspA family protein
MGRLKKIVVGHDLRVGGEIALQSAVVLAKRCSAALRLVYVVEAPRPYQRMSHPLTSPCAVEEIAQKVGEKLQALLARSGLNRLQVEYEVRKGKPFVELIIARRVWMADLIVVGDAHKPEEHFLGSTSERVLRKALVPVMIAKNPLNAAAKTFLVPTDFSSCARRAAEEALVLAENFHGRVVFVHVIDLYPFYAYTYGEEMAASLPVTPHAPAELEGEWQAFLSGLPLAKVEWEKRTEEGEAASTIVHQAEQRQADMVVMGTHGRSGLAHMLVGSVAEKVARAAPCPVLTIRPEALRFEMP